jgi:hypothetical protein
VPDRHAANFIEETDDYPKEAGAGRLPRRQTARHRLFFGQRLATSPLEVRHKVLAEREKPSQLSGKMRFGNWRMACTKVSAAG